MLVGTCDSFGKDLQWPLVQHGLCSINLQVLRGLLQSLGSVVCMLPLELFRKGKDASASHHASHHLDGSHFGMEDEPFG